MVLFPQKHCAPEQFILFRGAKNSRVGTSFCLSSGDCAAPCSAAQIGFHIALYTGSEVIARFCHEVLAGNVLVKLDITV